MNTNCEQKNTAETIYTPGHNEGMQRMQAVVAQRIRLMEDQDLTHMDKLFLAVGQNRDLTEQQKLAEVFRVKRLAMTGTAKVMHAVQHGREEMSEALAASSREACIDMMMDMLSRIDKWCMNRSHEELGFSHETRVQMKMVFSCIENDEPINLTKDEIIELTLSLTEQHCMMMTAEYVKTTMAETDVEAFVSGPADERRELVMAVAMNLKQTGKLPAELAKVSDEDYAAMVCAMDEVSGYCAEAAAGDLSLGKLCCAVGSILMGVFCVGASLLVTAGGSFLLGGVGFFCIWVGCSALTDGVREAYRNLFPAGISETRVGQAVTGKMHEVVALANDASERAVRKVQGIVQAVFSAVKVGFFVAKQSARMVVQAVKNRTVRSVDVTN